MPTSIVPSRSLRRVSLVALSQRQLPVAVRSDSLAALAKPGMAPAIAHDPANLFALDVAVDAGHPRVDFGEQQPLARLNDMIRPGGGRRRGSLDAGQAAVARKADQPGDPVGAVLRGAREVT